MSSRILIIDDDESLTAMLAEYLTEQGFEAATRSRGLEGVEAIADKNGSGNEFDARLADGSGNEVDARMADGSGNDSDSTLADGRGNHFDAVILDVMLPDLDGFEVCRRLRERSDVPILMLTARGEETDRIVGLEIGADDYLAKPFSPRELLARIRAVLRRSGRTSEPAPNRRASMRFGRLELDRDARLVRVDGEARTLTSHQFELLCLLAENAGRVLSRDQIMQGVRGHALEAFDRSIDNHVSRIRAAIEDDPKRPRRLLTVRGAGYVFARRQDERQER